MISLEIYRAAIGNFDFSAQLSLRSLYTNMNIGTRLSSTNLSRLLQGATICSIFLHLCLVLLLSGDIETNPGPVIPSKSVQGSFHQGDSRFGISAGSQCMCNALWAICFSKIKAPRFWTVWDLDTVLGKGNELYTSLGYESEYLSFEDLPNQIRVGEKMLAIAKSIVHVAELSHASCSFLGASPDYNCGILIACGFGTSFFLENGSVFIFDSHSRGINGLHNPNGTSVLLKFDRVVDAENYVKDFYLEQFGNLYVNYEVQYLQVNLSESDLVEVKKYFQREKRRDKNSETVFKEKERGRRQAIRSKLNAEVKKASNSERREKRKQLPDNEKEALNSKRREKRKQLPDNEKEMLFQIVFFELSKFGVRGMIKSQFGPRVGFFVRTIKMKQIIKR